MRDGGKTKEGAGSTQFKPKRGDCPFITSIQYAYSSVLFLLVFMRMRCICFLFLYLNKIIVYFLKLHGVQVRKGRLLGNSDQLLFLYKLPYNKYSMRSNDDFGNIMQKFYVIILFIKNKLKDTCLSILLVMT